MPGSAMSIQTLEIQRYILRIIDFPVTAVCIQVPHVVRLGLIFFLNQAKHQVVQALRAPCLLRWR